MLWAGLRLWGRQLRASGTRALCPQEFSAVCAQLPELVQEGPAWRKIPRIVGTVKAVGVAIVARKTRKVYRVRTRIRSRSLIGGATRYLAGGEVGRLAICRLDAPTSRLPMALVLGSMTPGDWRESRSGGCERRTGQFRSIGQGERTPITKRRD